MTASPEVTAPDADQTSHPEGSQLGASEDAADVQLESEANARAEKQAQLQSEAAAKETAAMAKRDRLAAEAAEEKARMREAEKANSIPAPAAPASTPAAPESQPESEFDPFTVPVATLTDDELAEQWDALSTVDEDLVAENARREAKLKEHEAIKEELRQAAHQIEREWYAYQKRHNHVLLPRRDAIRQEVQRREAEAAKAAAEAAAVGS